MNHGFNYNVSKRKDIVKRSVNKIVKIYKYIVKKRISIQDAEFLEKPLDIIDRSPPKFLPLFDEQMAGARHTVLPAYIKNTREMCTLEITRK